MQEQGEESEKTVQGRGVKKPLAAGAIVLLLGAVGYWAVASGIVDLGNFQVGKAPETFAAKVNGEGIEERMLDARFNQTRAGYEAQGVVFEEENSAQLKEQVLQDMIDERLLIQHAKAEGIRAQEQIVEEQYQQIVSQFGSEEQLKGQLETEGTTLQDVRTQIVETLLVQQLAEQQAAEHGVEISQEEIQQTYDEAVASGAEVPPFEEVQEEVREFVRQQKVSQLLADLVTQLREEAAIEILG